MYICVCKGITEDMLKKAASKGHKGKDLIKSLGIGDDCGTCLIDTLKKYEVTSHKKEEKNK